MLPQTSVHQRQPMYEDVVNVILDDLVKLLDPWEMDVTGDFNVRGNIKTVIRARHEHSKA